MWAILPIRERRCQDIDQVLLFCLKSVYSAAVKCQAKLLTFGVNCRLQLAGLGKKREETVKPTIFSLLCVESDFGTTDTTDKSFTVFFARWGVKFERQLKISACWVLVDNSTIGLHVPSRRKKSLQSYCSVDFDFLGPLMSRCVTTQVSVNSQIRVIKNVSFSLLLVTFVVTKTWNDFKPP